MRKIALTGTGWSPMTLMNFMAASWCFMYFHCPYWAQSSGACGRPVYHFLLYLYLWESVVSRTFQPVVFLLLGFCGSFEEQQICQESRLDGQWHWSRGSKGLACPVWSTMFQVWPKPILGTGQNWSAFDAPKLCWRVQGCGFELLLVFSAHVQEHIGHQKIPIQISWTFSAHLLVSRFWFLLVRMGLIWNCAFSILRVGLRTGHCRSFEDKRICEGNQLDEQRNGSRGSQGLCWSSMHYFRGRNLSWICVKSSNLIKR